MYITIDTVSAKAETAKLIPHTAAKTGLCTLPAEYIPTKIPIAAIQHKKLISFLFLFILYSSVTDLHFNALL